MVTFGELSEEDLARMPDEAFLKLFRIAQVRAAAVAGPLPTRLPYTAVTCA